MERERESGCVMVLGGLFFRFSLSVCLSWSSSSSSSLPSPPLLPLPPPPPPLLLLLLLLLRRRRFHCWLDFVFPVLFSYSPWIRNPSSSLSLSVSLSTAIPSLSFPSPPSAPSKSSTQSIWRGKLDRGRGGMFNAWGERERERESQRGAAERESTNTAVNNNNNKPGG